VRAARLHQYGEPLQIDEIDPPKTKGESVLVKVSGAGLCHSDVHLMKGEWKDILPLNLPLTIGHEIAGMEEVGELVRGFSKGDPVAIFGGWSCGLCPNCKSGDEQLCFSPRWPGLSQLDGGFAEYIHVPSFRFLVKADGLNPRDIAPLTDAGLTPYRAVKKIKHLLNPGSFALVLGIGGLGSYAVQYLKLLTPAKVISVVRNEAKARLAKEMGSDYVINSLEEDVTKRLREITSSRRVEVAMDIVCSTETLTTSVKSLGKKGTLALVGLMGKSLELPIMRSIMNENCVMGSLWGNYNELCEVINLARQNKIKMPVEIFKLEDVNRAVNKLQDRKIHGRAVLVP
jgi:alcohol dehydrogenase, propanol-preferring